MDIKSIIAAASKKYFTEVAQPKSPNEQRFVDQHTIEFWPHPVAFDSQFDGTIQKDTSRDADYQPGEDEAVYDQAYNESYIKTTRTSTGGGTVHHGGGRIHLTQDHINKIKKGILTHVSSAGNPWQAETRGDKVHFSSNGYSNIVKVPVKHFHEDAAVYDQAYAKDDVTEAVEISHDRYIRSHSKKAKGSGSWIFTSKRSGDIDHNDKTSTYHHPVSASFSDASKGARDWAKKHGHHAAYVAEDSKLSGFTHLQELSKDTLTKYVAAAKNDKYMAFTGRGKYADREGPKPTAADYDKRSGARGGSTQGKASLKPSWYKKPEVVAARAKLDKHLNKRAAGIEKATNRLAK